MAVSNTITYVTDFDLVLQRRLNRPMTWKEVCDVTYSNANIIRSSYISTMPSVQTVDRGVGVALQTFAQTSNTITIETGRDLGVLVDLADDAQSPWTKKAELFDRIGSLLNEYVESFFLADHASWTDFTNASIGGAAGNITVSASNIDDIIRGVKREIRENNAQELADQNGVCFDWRAADFEYLEAKPYDGLVKSSLINGENPEEGNAQQAILSPYIQYVQLQRLSERTPEMVMQ